MAPLGVFSDHADRLSSPCPAIGVELGLGTAPEEEPSCGGTSDRGELIACSSRRWEEIVLVLELCEACRPTSPTLVGVPYIVAREPEADDVGVNPTSDTSIRAADGRPSWLSLVKFSCLL
jgi:hypothetical protein